MSTSEGGRSRSGRVRKLSSKLRTSIEDQEAAARMKAEATAAAQQRKLQQRQIEAINAAAIQSHERSIQQQQQQREPRSVSGGAGGNPLSAIGALMSLAAAATSAKTVRIL